MYHRVRAGGRQPIEQIVLAGDVRRKTELRVAVLEWDRELFVERAIEALGDASLESHSDHRGARPRRERRDVRVFVVDAEDLHPRLLAVKARDCRLVPPLAREIHKLVLFGEVIDEAVADEVIADSEMMVDDELGRREADMRTAARRRSVPCAHIRRHCRLC